MTETCATCRYWRMAGTGWGRCHRNPPARSSSLDSGWPQANAEQWCGEHRPATEPAALQAAALLVAQSHISGPTGDTVEVPRTFFEPFCKLLGVKPR